MYKYFNSVRENIFLKRIYSIRNPIFSYCLASILDIFLILYISSIFKIITNDLFEGNLLWYVFQFLLLILGRTIVIFFLRKYSFRMIFYKKYQNEEFLVNKFILNRIKFLDDENALNRFKEKLINSSKLATINFDIPIMSIVSELVFTIGGIFILINIFGFQLLLFNSPIFILLIIFSKFVSQKLNTLGSKILLSTEKRLNTIDNISEIAIELSSLREPHKLVDYLNKNNKIYNKILSEQITTSNMMQINTESASYIIILISLICLLTNVTETSLANSATSLAILSRMVPSFTRSISFITQLQFGVPSIKRLSQVEKISGLS